MGVHERGNLHFGWLEVERGGFWTIWAMSVGLNAWAVMKFPPGPCSIMDWVWIWAGILASTALSTVDWLCSLRSPDNWSVYSVYLTVGWRGLFRWRKEFCRMLCKCLQYGWNFLV